MTTPAAAATPVRPTSSSDEVGRVWVINSAMVYAPTAMNAP